MSQEANDAHYAKVLSENVAFWSMAKTIAVLHQLTPERTSILIPHIQTLLSPTSAKTYRLESLSPEFDTEQGWQDVLKAVYTSPESIWTAVFYGTLANTSMQWPLFLRILRTVREQKKPARGAIVLTLDNATMYDEERGRVSLYAPNEIASMAK